MRSRKRSQACRWISSAFCLIALSGCGSGFTPLERTLPQAPAFAQPVAYSPGKIGESCYVALDRNEGTTRRANGTVVRFRSWYDGVRKNYNPKEAKS